MLQKIKMLQKLVFVLLVIPLKSMFLQQSVFAEKLCNIFLQQNCCKKFGFCNIKIVAKKKAIVAKKKPMQGKHIWHSHDHGNLDAHQWRKKMYEGADEYKVVKAPPDFNIRLKLMNVATGKYFKMKFTKERVKYLFETYHIQFIDQSKLNILFLAYEWMK